MIWFWMQQRDWRRPYIRFNTHKRHPISHCHVRGMRCLLWGFGWKLTLDSKVHGANKMGPVVPRWAPCWSHEPCYLGYLIILASHFTWRFDKFLSVPRWGQCHCWETTLSGSTPASAAWAPWEYGVCGRNPSDLWFLRCRWRGEHTYAGWLRLRYQTPEHASVLDKKYAKSQGESVCEMKMLTGLDIDEIKQKCHLLRKFSVTTSMTFLLS